MPRATWARLLLLLLVVPLASCFDADETCPVCPPEDSSRIDVVVPADSEVDSIHVNVDGLPRATVRRGQRIAFPGLPRGLHTVATVRWYESFGLVTSRSSSMQIQLERGETRVLIFHNDFPRVAGGHAPPGAALALAGRSSRDRVG
jgi:hypothetical protein